MNFFFNTCQKSRPEVDEFYSSDVKIEAEQVGIIW